VAESSAGDRIFRRPDIPGSFYRQELSLMQVAEKASMPHLFTVAEYMRLDLSSRTELVGGVIYGAHRDGNCVSSLF
jgi:hypothetical protein